ncbi:MAG TPA: histidine phosphatase family protein [Candidatus Dormibacteraeota bacterium]|nr:histidine phosphatase family protein [Candidatus Dormibacteraeota bacterium]
MAAGAGRVTEAIKSLEAAFLVGVEGVTEVWLVRHGDCYEDMEDESDPPLSALGRKQAELLAGRLRKLNPAAVYSSPYRRAIETARTITDDVHVDERLVEMEMQLNDDGEFDLHEHPAAVVERMNAAIGEIASANEGRRVIVVGHGAAMIVFLTHVLQLEPGQLRFLPYFTSVNVVRVLGDRHIIATLGDVSHLE